MHSECSSQSGLLLAIGVHRGTWLPGESTSTFAAFCMRVHRCTYKNCSHTFNPTRTYTCVYGHEVRYCQIAWHVVSMYSIVSSVTACEITWLRSDGYDPTYLCSRPSKQSSYELLYRKETLVPRAIHSRALNFYKNSN